MKLCGIAIVGRHDEPLLLRSSENAPPCEPLEHIIYAALDIVEDQGEITCRTREK